MYPQVNASQAWKIVNPAIAMQPEHVPLHIHSVLCICLRLRIRILAVWGHGT